MLMSIQMLSWCACVFVDAYTCMCDKRVRAPGLPLHVLVAPLMHVCVLVVVSVCVRVWHQCLAPVSQLCPGPAPLGLCPMLHPLCLHSACLHGACALIACCVMHLEVSCMGCVRVHPHKVSDGSV
jgi:hypothetical protein